MSTREAKASCNHCCIIGHFKKNCPQLKPKVEVTVKVEEPKIEPAVTLTNIAEVRQLVTQYQPDVITLHMTDGFAYQMYNHVPNSSWVIKYLKIRTPFAAELHRPPKNDGIYSVLASCRTFDDILAYIEHHKFHHLTITCVWERMLKVLSDRGIVVYNKVYGKKLDDDKLVYTELFGDEVNYNDLHNDLPHSLKVQMLAAYGDIIGQPFNLVEELQKGKDINLTYI